MPPQVASMLTSADLGYEPCDYYPSLDASEIAQHIRTNNTNNNKEKVLPPNPPRTRRRNADGSLVKQVYFSNEDVKIIEVEHMDDLPGEMIWYSRDEYDEIKGRNSQIVKLIKAGEFEENDNYSCRGLEHKLKEVFRQRRANKFNALNAVLEEQDRQINRNIFDPHLISAAYQTVSVRCQESANTIAIRDYRFSLNYDPNKPASGKHSKSSSGAAAASAAGDNSAVSPSTKEKKKKKKEKKDKDKDKDKDKHKNHRQHHSASNIENDEDDPSLSPKDKKKKRGVKKMASGARRMMRRMSM